MIASHDFLLFQKVYSTPPDGIKFERNPSSFNGTTPPKNTDPEVPSTYLTPKEKSTISLRLICPGKTGTETVPGLTRQDLSDVQVLKAPSSTNPCGLVVEKRSLPD